jgi:vacuolar-type H+-ATPase subunit I/STV1
MISISRALERNIVVLVVLTRLEAPLTNLEPIRAVVVLILPFILEAFISIIGGGRRLHPARLGGLSLGQ